MKTILIPVYNGLRARMFFQTDTYPELLRGGDIRLVVVSPAQKAPFYQEQFPEQNVIFEPLDIMNEHWLGKKLARVSFNLLPTSTIRSKHRIYAHRYGKRLKYGLLGVANRLVGPIPFVREAIRFFDRFVPLNPQVEALLAKHQPDLVFIPDVIFGPDRIFARAAKRKGIFIIGTPRSWDNLTSKGFAIVKPDKLLVLTSRMVPEAIRYVGMRPEDVAVTGPPQFDAYMKPLTATKAEFCRKLGIPPERRILLCAPFFNPYTGSAVVIINALTAAIREGRLPADLHILVRYRPATPAIPEGELAPSDHLTVSWPCTRSFPVHDLVSPTQDFEWTRDDVSLLIHSLAFSDVVLNVVSTLSIDAIAFDRPVVNVRFEADPDCPPKFSQELMLPEHDHFKAIEATGGVRLAWSMDELIGAISTYLENPQLDAAGRARLRREQIELLDGGAGRRVAEFLKATLARRAAEDARFTELNSEIV